MIKRRLEKLERIAGKAEAITYEEYEQAKRRSMDNVRNNIIRDLEELEDGVITVKVHINEDAEKEVNADTELMQKYEKANNIKQDTGAGERILQKLNVLAGRLKSQDEE